MALLEITGIRKSYGAGEVALAGVDMSVQPREVVAVLGLSGSGKSTLLRCINRLVEPDAGEVVLDGVTITALGRKELRRARQRMGMIFQEFNLVHRLTVLENVLSGRLGATSTWRCITRAFRAEDIERALEICERVGILEHVRKRADQLSGGQRQRVGIARALMQKPKILLADEPTSSLDVKIGVEVMELMCEIAQEEHIPIVVSLHDLTIARRFSHRIVGLSYGVKVLDAPTTAVNQDSVEAIYNMAAQ